MHPIVARTFGGLSATMYCRHFLFGLVVSAFVYTMVGHDGRAVGWATALMLIANSLLYPYARFVYESVVDFILGRNVVVADGLFVLACKTVTIAACWVLAPLVAPIGLAYLYFSAGRTLR